MTDRYDRVFSSLWREFDGDRQKIEATLHKMIVSDLTNEKINLQLDKKIIDFLVSFKQHNSKNLIYVWTARDKTVHEHVVRTLLRRNNVSDLFDGLIFARGNSKRKCDVVE